MSAYYNIGPYGVAHYSKGSVYSLAGNLAPSLVFSATFAAPAALVGNLPVFVTLPPAAITFGNPVLLSGDLRPSVSLHASLAYTAGLAGNLPVPVSFAASLAYVTNLTGALAPSVSFGPSPLSYTTNLAAATLPVFVGIAGALTVGPYWAEDPDCPVSLFTPDQLCPLVPWRETVDG
jgi:hypothetical protein